MARGDTLGEFEHIVLLALMRLRRSGEDPYGVTVRQEIEDRIGREVSIGAIYATLDRLESKKLVKSWVGDPTAERGGRAKRHFTVTPRGAGAVSRAQSALRRMVEGLHVGT